MVEISLQILFRNFVYQFAGKLFHQEDGGPIGVRATGSAAELVMLDWSEKYREILENSGLWVALLSGYVDDGRQGSTILPEGSRFSRETNKFEFSEEALEEDVARRDEGESVNSRMARVCCEAMNSINDDLKFTIETQD